MCNQSEEGGGGAACCHPSLSRVCLHRHAALLWHCIRRAQQLTNALKNSSRQVFIRPFKPPCFTVSSKNLPLMRQRAGSHDVFLHRRAERRSAPPTACPSIVLLRNYLRHKSSAINAMTTSIQHQT
jgi:hypothetical protein